MNRLQDLSKVGSYIKSTGSERFNPMLEFFISNLASRLSGWHTKSFPADSKPLSFASESFRKNCSQRKFLRINLCSKTFRQTAFTGSGRDESESARRSVEVLIPSTANTIRYSETLAEAYRLDTRRPSGRRLNRQP